ncbi:MAG: NfeD family protein [Desulfomonile tiedjei]|nr:NfeD family protein [Desulfomonile tiedjei]
MESWWLGLSLLNKAFVISALAFTVLFLWQIVIMIMGMDTDAHAHIGAEGVDHGDFGHAGDSGGESGHEYGGEAATFTFVSIRSIIAFGTLFSWAGALYLATGVSAILAILYSAAWGLVAMFAVSYVLYWLLSQQERGNASVWTAIGEEGTVYMDIPEGGTGKIRVMVSGAISFVNARSRDGGPLTSGAEVRVVGVVNDNTVEVEGIRNPEEG